MQSEFKCEECGQIFKSERSLHAHFKKHGLTVAEYYTKHFPRFNMLTKEPLPFKNKQDYFTKDFSNRKQMLEWIKLQNAEDPKLKQYLLRKIYERMSSKQSYLMPGHIELELCQMPPLSFYKKCFGSYTETLNQLKSNFNLENIRLVYDKNIVENFFEKDRSYENLEILIDTREQQPLVFAKSKVLKLDFGDYTIGGKDYSYTFIDRKSEADFKSTMSVGFERFVREIERAKQFDSFLYILVDSSIEKIKNNNSFSPHKSNLSYIWHNVRKLLRLYPDNCQFIFSGSRKASEFLVPRLLKIGKKLWSCDIQYFIDERIQQKA